MAGILVDRGRSEWRGRDDAHIPLLVAGPRTLFAVAWLACVRVVARVWHAGANEIAEARTRHGWHGKRKGKGDALAV